MNMTSAYALTHENWKDLFFRNGFSHHVLPFWLKGLYKDAHIWDRHVSKDLITTLKDQLDFQLPEISSVQESKDGTCKFLVRFQDSMQVETVLIPFHKRFTVCLSTQVGCGMNCSFCYTGTQGLKRNLTSGEIVGQYLVATKWLKERNQHEMNPNIVFMGQGEPLHNYDEVKKAITVFNDPQILSIGKRQMTLSTVGYLPGLKKLADFPSINFALSLHSPFEEERKKLIPITEKFSLSEVMEALDEHQARRKQIITFEYLLIKNLNMTSDHVVGLSNLLGKRQAILNLIPFNPFPGSEWERPEVEDIENFKNKCVEHKLRVMVRTTKGSDILAACGQLKVNKLARNHAVQ